jgi:hypothetical protein
MSDFAVGHAEWMEKIVDGCRNDGGWMDCIMKVDGEYLNNQL